MKKNVLFLLVLFVFIFMDAQTVVQLPVKAKTDLTWQTPEKEYFSEVWNTQVITNVSEPTLLVYEPSEEKKNGTAVIVAPGGGLYALSIELEGKDVAKWLVDKGITVFVLKYRVMPSGDDGTAEFSNALESNPETLFENVKTVMPLSIEDGLNAVSYVRKNAEKYGVAADKIGFMGFSAGGLVTVGVSKNYTTESRPDFVVPVYAWTTPLPKKAPKADAPPMLVVCATDDELDLAPESIALFNQYYDKKLNVELHMYAKGKHGFGMRKNNLPSDGWIARFYEWAVSEGLVNPKE